MRCHSALGREEPRYRRRPAMAATGPRGKMGGRGGPGVRKRLPVRDQPTRSAKREAPRMPRDRHELTASQGDSSEGRPSPLCQGTLCEERWAPRLLIPVSARPEPHTRRCEPRHRRLTWRGEDASGRPQRQPGQCLPTAGVLGAASAAFKASGSFHPCRKHHFSFCGHITHALLGGGREERQRPYDSILSQRQDLWLT